jgi:hypothetical protein
MICVMFLNYVTMSPVGYRWACNLESAMDIADEVPQVKSRLLLGESKESIKNNWPHLFKAQV